MHLSKIKYLFCLPDRSTRKIALVISTFLAFQLFLFSRLSPSLVSCIAHTHCKPCIPLIRSIFPSRELTVSEFLYQPLSAYLFSPLLFRNSLPLIYQRYLIKLKIQTTVNNEYVGKYQIHESPNSYYKKPIGFPIT